MNHIEPPCLFLWECLHWVLQLRSVVAVTLWGSWHLHHWSSCPWSREEGQSGGAKQLSWPMHFFAAERQPGQPDSAKAWMSKSSRWDRSVAHLATTFSTHVAQHALTDIHPIFAFSVPRSRQHWHFTVPSVPHGCKSSNCRSYSSVRLNVYIWTRLKGARVLRSAQVQGAQLVEELEAGKGSNMQQPDAAAMEFLSTTLNTQDAAVYTPGEIDIDYINQVETSKSK